MLPVRIILALILLNFENAVTAFAWTAYPIRACLFVLSEDNDEGATPNQVERQSKQEMKGLAEPGEVKTTPRRRASKVLLNDANPAWLSSNEIFGANSVETATSRLPENASIYDDGRTWVRIV